MTPDDFDEIREDCRIEREYYAERIANCKYPFFVVRTYDGKKHVDYRNASPSSLEIARFVQEKFPELPSEEWERPDGTSEWAKGSFASAYYHESAKELMKYQWQPIETAPKDGTEILGLFPNYHLRMNVTSMFWGSPGVWVNAFEDENYRESPTHWMPLPPAPKKKR